MPHCISHTGALTEHSGQVLCHQRSRVDKIMAVTHPSGGLAAPTCNTVGRRPSSHRKGNQLQLQDSAKGSASPQVGPVSLVTCSPHSPQISNRDRRQLSSVPEGSSKRPSHFPSTPRTTAGLNRNLRQIVRLPVSTTKAIRSIIGRKNTTQGNDLFRMSVGSRI